MSSGFVDADNYMRVVDREQTMAVGRAMYEYTQERLAQVLPEGTTHLTLYRGFNTGPIKSELSWKTVPFEVNYDGNALESWSADDTACKDFGTTLIQMNVPIVDIVATCRTGFGCLTESEFVIAGSVPGHEAVVLDAKHYEYKGFGDTGP
jgi:hypothetical protein